MELILVVVSIALLVIVLKWKPETAKVIMLIYLCTLLYLVLFSRKQSLEYAIYILPFRSLRYRMGLTEWLKVLFLDHRITFTWNAVKQNLLNILLFVPFGILLPVTVKRATILKNGLILGFILSVTIEYTQFISRLGIADIDDVFNNVFGVLIGWFIYRRFLYYSDLID